MSTVRTYPMPNGVDKADQSRGRALKALAGEAKRKKVSRYLELDYLAVLATDAVHGGKLAKEISVGDFEQKTYRELIGVCRQFWAKYDKPPGHQLPQAVAEFASAEKAEEWKQSIVDVFVRGGQDLNGEFVLDSYRGFRESREFEYVAFKAAADARGGPAKYEKARTELTGYLTKRRTNEAKQGLDMRDAIELLRALHDSEDREQYTLGIAALDKHCPLKGGQVTLLLAPTGRGKTQFLCHLARNNAVTLNEILYVTFEMSEAEIWERLYQSALYTTLKEEDEPIINTYLDLDKAGRFAGLRKVEAAPRPSLAESLGGLPNRIVASDLEWMFRRIHVKYWPGGTATVAMIEAYIEQRIAVGKRPDMLLVDYAGKFKLSGGEKMLRQELQDRVMELRNLATKHQIPVVTAQQTNRISFKASRVNMTHISESAGMCQEADRVIAYSQEDDIEKPHGIARLLVDKQRRGRDKFWVVMTQNYRTGEFAGDSAEFDDKLLKEVLEGLPSAGGKAAPKVTDETMDEAVAALKASGKQRWRSKVQSPEYIGKAIKSAIGPNATKQKVADVVAALLQAGRLVTVQEKDDQRKTRDYLRLQADDLIAK